MQKHPDATAELVSLDLGDKRRDSRIRRVVAALQENPAAHFPAVMRTVAEREALYRALNSEHVSLHSLLAPHIGQTVERMAQHAERPIVIIDKTSFVFGGEAERDGLERISPRKQGFDAFVALAVSSSRHPHGVLAVSPTEVMGASAAARWHETVELAAAGPEQRRIHPIYVMDREADAYELFGDLAAQGRDFVIRVSFDRLVREHGSTRLEALNDVVRDTDFTYATSVRLSRRPSTGRSSSARKKHPSRTTRDAVLKVRACPIVMPKPKAPARRGPCELALHLVQVVEPNPPEGCEPVQWLLATTLPIGDARSVEAIVDVYRARWTIEEYFKALKTGCSYEKRQLESLHALLNALGLLVPLAWRLLALRCLADEDPNAPAGDVLDSDGLHVLRKLSGDVKLGTSPTAAEVVLALAGLGGHFPQNGRPGWLVVWRGLQKVLDRLEGYRLAKAEM